MLGSDFATTSVQAKILCLGRLVQVCCLWGQLQDKHLLSPCSLLFLFPMQETNTMQHTPPTAAN